MMREILFRGLTKNKKQWLMGDLLQVTVGKQTYHLIFEDKFTYDGKSVEASSHALVNSETVGEYTGFKDINNERIFEGDILFEYKTTEINGKKCYEPVRKFAVELPDDYVTIIEGKDMGYDYEVIGDIHTNPDFLGGAANV